MGGRGRTWRKPTLRQGEHAKSTRNSAWDPQATVLNNTTPCCHNFGCSLWICNLIVSHLKIHSKHHPEKETFSSFDAKVAVSWAVVYFYSLPLPIWHTARVVTVVLHSTTVKHSVLYVLYVHAEGTFEHSQRFASGFSPGCAPPPLLFNLRTNTCQSRCTNRILIKYADDSVTVSPLCDQLIPWCEESYLQINTSKTDH